MERPSRYHPGVFRDRSGQPARTGLPLADLIGQAMARQSLTLGDMARLIRAAGASCASPSLICHWRSGRITPMQHHVRLIAKALRLPLYVVAEAADAQRQMLRRGGRHGFVKDRVTGSDGTPGFDWSQSGSVHALATALGSVVTDRCSSLSLRGPALISLASDWLNIPPDHLLAVLRGTHAAASFVDQIEQGLPRLRLLEAIWGGQRTRKLLDAELGVVVEILRHSAYTESIGRRLYGLAAELGRMAGWASFDAGLHSSAQRYWIAALHAAHTAGDRAVGSNILKSMCLQLYDFGRLTDALVLVQSARRSIGQATPRAAAMLALREARMHAALHDTRRCEQLIIHAEASLSRASANDGEPEWVLSHFDDGEYLAQVGTCFLDLEQAAKASTYLVGAVDRLPLTKVRDRATYLIRAAAASTLQGAADHALDLLHQAIPLIEEAPSRRNVQRILSVRASMPVDATDPAVEEVDKQLSVLVA